MDKTFAAIDLFSGSGGLSLGLENSGFDVRAAVEINPQAVKTYRKNHPHTVVLESDIRQTTGRNLLDAAGINDGELDLLAGCPPCQGFSRIKSRNKSNTDDPRNDFILDYIRIVKELKPKLVLLENVPGLADDYRFKHLINELHELGYKTDYGVLNAADFGVPQRRKRLIMMASRISEIKLPEGTNRKKTVRDYIGKLDIPTESVDLLQRMHLKNTPRIKKLISQIPKDGGSRSALSQQEQLDCHKRTTGFRDIYGRMKWDDVSPTLTGGCFNPSKGRFLHPAQNRAITLREAALLQTFPKRYVFFPEMGLSAIAKMIGDALPPVFGEAQGKHLIKLLNT